MQQRGLLIALSALTWLCCTCPGSAQLQPGSLRFGLDVDVLAAGAVWTRPEGAKTHSVTRDVSIGTNQLGNSRVAIPITPLGLAVDYVLRPEWLLGMRTGFGFDHLAPEHAASQRAVSLSLMPEVMFVPTDHGVTRLFVKFSPIAQFTQLKQGASRQHMFMGCFSVGAGAFLFASERSSIDLGAYFEGRFGQLKGANGGRQTDVDDLRGVLRLGVSLWR